MIKKKNKNADETLEIIKRILDYNNNVQNLFCASKVDKKKFKPKTEESIADRVKLKNSKIAEIKKEEKEINNLLFKHCFTDYKNQVICIKTYARQKEKEMKIKYIQSKKY